MPDEQRNLSDIDLVQAVRAGDRRSYEILVDRYLTDVHATAYRIIGNASDAEDVAQETFLRVYQRLGLFDKRHVFRNWILKIATNLAINHLRARRRERMLKIRMTEDLPEQSSPSAPQREIPGPTEWQYWLGQIEEQQRTAIVLFHFDRMSYAGVAEVLDVPLNTVRTLLHRGRQRLRDLMTNGIASENQSWNVAMPKT